MNNKKNKIAIFDIDGTIFRKNLHFELINELTWMKIFPAKARNTLTEIYTNWLEHEGTYDDYRQALVSLYSEHIKGCSQDEVLKASRVMVPFHAKRTYIFAEKLIKKLRVDGYHLIAVSGSPVEVVEEYNRNYLKFDYAFGSVYAMDDEKRYTGKAEFEPSKNKGHVVEQYMYEHKLTFEGSYGVGDTESDISFLKLVENPIAFNPNQNLKAVAEKEQWKIVVEKKDVVYEIEPGCSHSPNI
ncbi:MAG: HAD-IB family phosphatase [Candidatus Moranbacteria bacterium]|nr:HAD-IB family phosphatase [Candidatus Moranbacteria bacterium]